MGIDHEHRNDSSRSYSHWPEDCWFAKISDESRKESEKIRQINDHKEIWETVLLPPHWIWSVTKSMDTIGILGNIAKRKACLEQRSHTKKDNVQKRLKNCTERKETGIESPSGEWSDGIPCLLIHPCKYVHCSYKNHFTKKSHPKSIMFLFHTHPTTGNLSNH